MRLQTVLPAAFHEFWHRVYQSPPNYEQQIQRHRERIQLSMQAHPTLCRWSGLRSICANPAKLLVH
eukprot:6421726-Amphidinium_carterae.3